MSQGYIRLLIEQLRNSELGVEAPASAAPPLAGVDLDRIISELEALRSETSRGSAGRFRFSSLISFLKAKRNRFNRTNMHEAIGSFGERDLLTEELVSIKRKGTPPSLYDVTFDNDGNIVGYHKDFKGDDIEIVAGKGVSHQPSTWQNEQQQKMKKHRILRDNVIKSVGELDVIHFLEDLESSGQTDNLFMPSTDPAGIADALNSLLNTGEMWKQTLDWGVRPGVGRGETMVHLAFASNPGPKEPDWVAADGSVKLSIKYAEIAGGSKARSGEKSTSMSAAISSFLRNLGVAMTTEEISPGTLEQHLLTLKENVGPEQFNEKLESLMDDLADIKLAAVTEHGSNGIMFFDGSQFKFLSATDASLLPVYTIVSSTRISFFHVDNNVSDTFDKVLLDAIGDFKKSRLTPSEKRQMASSKRESEKLQKLSEFQSAGIEDAEDLLNLLPPEYATKKIAFIQDLPEGQRVFFQKTQSRGEKGRSYIAYVNDSSGNWRPLQGSFDRRGTEI